MTENHRRLFFLAIFGLVFYLVGASFVQSFVTYPTWKAVGASGFQAYYQELSWRIIRIMVIPGVVEILLTAVLLRFPPSAIPRWPIALALVLGVVRFVSTAINQGRVQAQLGAEGLPLNAVDTLIRSDYLTQAASLARASLYAWMMALVIHEPPQLRDRRVTIATE